MCGRYVLVKIEIDGAYHMMRVWVGQDEFSDKEWFKHKIAEIRSRYDIRPTQDVVIMHVDRKAKALRMPRSKWGWQVPWMPAPLINARSESLLSSKTWSLAIKERRCIIPASAFYEWQRRNDAPKPVPWEIKRTGADLFYFAGLWKNAVDKKTGEEVIEATIITQPGNHLLREVHNHGGNAGRQPVFLDNDKIDRWLDPDLTSPDDIMPLLRQIEDGEWQGRMLNKIGNDSEHAPPIAMGTGQFVAEPELSKIIVAGESEEGGLFSEHAPKPSRKARKRA